MRIARDHGHIRRPNGDTSTQKIHLELEQLALSQIDCHRENLHTAIVTDLAATLTPQLIVR